jgi:membrane-bound serine protease (ClpP class)
VNTTLEIIQTFRAADVPVIIYVAPSGAQAASAGSLITAAAHVAAMAPETVVGAASPVDGSGDDLGDTIYLKAVEDLKATMRNLTERRGPEAVDLAEAMIEEARAVTAREALEVGFIDVIACGFIAVRQGLDLDNGKALLTIIIGWVAVFIVSLIVSSILTAVGLGAAATFGALGGG